MLTCDLLARFHHREGLCFSSYLAVTQKLKTTQNYCKDELHLAKFYGKIKKIQGSGWQEQEWKGTLKSYQ